MAFNDVYRATVVFRVYTQGADELTRMDSTLGKLAGVALKTGGALALIGGTAAGMALKTAAGFEESQAHIKAFAASSDVARQQVDQMGKQILDTMPKLGIAAGKASEGLYNIMSASIQGKDAMITLRSAALAASAANTDLSITTDALTTVVKAYGLQGQQIARAQDDLTKSAALGKMELKDLASSIGLVIPIAAHAGVSIKELGSLMAVLTNQGLTASESVTAIRNSIITLAAPSKQQTVAMKQLGLSMDDINIHAHGLIGVFENINKALLAQGYTAQQADEVLIHLFRHNSEAVRAFTASFNDGGKQIHATLTQIQNDVGFTAEAQQRAAKTTEAAWNRMTATVDALMIKLGSRMLPAIASGLDSVVSWLNKHDKDIQNAFSAVFDPIGSTLHQFFTELGSDKNLKEIKSGFRELGQAAGKAGQAIQIALFGESGSGDGGWGKTPAQQAADQTASAFKDLAHWVNHSMDAFIDLARAGDATAKWLNDVSEGENRVAKDIRSGIGNAITALEEPVHKLSQAFEGLWSTTPIGAFGNEIWGLISGPLDALATKLGEINDIGSSRSPTNPASDQGAGSFGFNQFRTARSPIPLNQSTLRQLGITNMSAARRAASLNPSLFYLPPGTAMNNYMDLAKSGDYPGGYQAAVSHAGILVNAQGQAVAPTSHIDIPLPPGSAMRLPGTKNMQYRLLRIGKDSTGAPYEVWMDPFGKVFNYYHEDPRKPGFRALERQFATGRPVYRSGGSQVGQVAPQGYGGQYYYGSHWHIATGPGALTDFQAMQRGARAPSTTTSRLGPGRSGSEITGINPAYLPADLRHDHLVPNIVAAARGQHLSPAEVAALVEFESHGDPTQTSPTGNMGLTQLSQELVRKYGITRPYDPKQNLAGGARYFAELLRGPAHGDLFTAYGMYYAGEKGFLDSKAGKPGAAPWSDVAGYANRAVKAAKFYSKGEIHAKTGGRRRGGQTPAQRRAQYWRDHDKMTNAVWAIKYGSNKGEQPMGAEAWRRQQMYLAMHPEADPHLKVGMGRGPNAIPWDLPLAPMDQAQVFADEYARQGTSLENRIGKLTGAAYDIYNQPSMRQAVSKYVSRIAQLHGRQVSRAENERRVNLMIAKREGDWATVQSDIDSNIADRLTKQTALARHDLAIGDRAGMNAAIDRVIALQGRQQKRADTDRQLQMLIARRAGDWATVMALIDQRIADDLAKETATATHLALSGQGTTLDFAEAVQQAAKDVRRQRKRADRVADVQSQIAEASGDYASRLSYLQGKPAEDLNQAMAQLTMSFHDLNVGVDDAIQKGVQAIAEQEAWDLAAAQASGALDLVVGRLSDFASTLDVITTQTKERVMQDALGGATSVQQQYVDGLSAILDAQALVANAYAGLDLVIAANRSDLDGMAQGLETVTGFLESQWLHAVQTSSSEQTQYAQQLREAAKAQADVTHAQNVASIQLGMIEENAAKVNNGLQAIVTEGTDRISFLTTMLGRAGSGAESFGDNMQTAVGKTIAAVKNLGSLSDIISGLQSAAAAIKEHSGTSFARTGQFDPNDVTGYKQAVEAQTTATWDQVANSLHLNKSAGYVDDYLSDLGDEIALQTKEVLKARVIYGEGSTQYQKELATLQALQKEQKDLTNAVAIATNTFDYVTVSADATGDSLASQQAAYDKQQQDIADASTAMENFRTNGIDAATEAYTSHVGVFKTATDDMKSAMDTASKGATSLGSQMVATVTQLQTLEGPIGSLVTAITNAYTAINQLITGQTGDVTPGTETGPLGNVPAGKIPTSTDKHTNAYNDGYAAGKRGDVMEVPSVYNVTATNGQKIYAQDWINGWVDGRKAADQSTPAPTGGSTNPTATPVASGTTAGTGASAGGGATTTTKTTTTTTVTSTPTGTTVTTSTSTTGGGSGGTSGLTASFAPTTTRVSDDAITTAAFGTSAAANPVVAAPLTTAQIVAAANPAVASTPPVVQPPPYIATDPSKETAIDFSNAFNLGQATGIKNLKPITKPPKWSDDLYANYMRGWTNGQEYRATHMWITGSGDESATNNPYLPADTYPQDALPVRTDDKPGDPTFIVWGQEGSGYGSGVIAGYKVPASKDVGRGVPMDEKSLGNYVSVVDAFNRAAAGLPPTYFGLLDPTQLYAKYPEMNGMYVASDGSWYMDRNDAIARDTSLGLPIDSPMRGFNGYAPPPPQTGMLAAQEMLAQSQGFSTGYTGGLYGSTMDTPTFPGDAGGGPVEVVAPDTNDILNRNAGQSSQDVSKLQAAIETLTGLLVRAMDLDASLAEKLDVTPGSGFLGNSPAGSLYSFAQMVNLQMTKSPS